jgi:hypothetical protein
MKLDRLRPHGFGSFLQVVQLLGLAVSFYTLIEAQHATQEAASAATAANGENIKRALEAGKDVNNEITKTRDSQRDMRRDIEAEFRREIDLACACCRSRSP